MFVLRVCVLFDGTLEHSDYRYIGTDLNKLVMPKSALKDLQLDFCKFETLLYGTDYSLKTTRRLW